MLSLVQTGGTATPAAPQRLSHPGFRVDSSHDVVLHFDEVHIRLLIETHLVRFVELRGRSGPTKVYLDYNKQRDRDAYRDPW